MNAIQFIKENGVDKARKVIDGAPGGATHLSDDACHYVNADFKPLPAHIKEQLPELIVIEHLKRLVESVDLVKRYRGIAEVKTLHQDEFWNERVFERLKQAIADYESIYGVSMFKVGDKVVFGSGLNTDLFTIKSKPKKNNGVLLLPVILPNGSWFDLMEQFVRHATPEEIAVEHRIDHFVDINNMGDDSHIENHISPLCKMGVK